MLGLMVERFSRGQKLIRILIRLLEVTQVIVEDIIFQFSRAVGYCFSPICVSCPRPNNFNINISSYFTVLLDLIVDFVDDNLPFIAPILENIEEPKMQGRGRN